MILQQLIVLYSTQKLSWYVLKKYVKNFFFPEKFCHLSSVIFVVK